MVLIGIYPAYLSHLDNEIGKSIDMIGLITEGPVGQLDRERIVITNLDIFIRFASTRTIIEDIGNDDVASNWRRGNSKAGSGAESGVESGGWRVLWNLFLDNREKNQRRNIDHRMDVNYQNK